MKSHCRKHHTTDRHTQGGTAVFILLLIIIGHRLSNDEHTEQRWAERDHKAHEDSRRHRRRNRKVMERENKKAMLDRLTIRGYVGRADIPNKGAIVTLLCMVGSDGMPWQGAGLLMGWVITAVIGICLYAGQKQEDTQEVDDDEDEEGRGLVKKRARAGNRRREGRHRQALRSGTWGRNTGRILVLMAIMVVGTQGVGGEMTEHRGWDALATAAALATGSLATAEGLKLGQWKTGNISEGE